MRGLVQENRRQIEQVQRELERLRDQCLVAVLRGLRSVPYGAGETLAAYESRLTG